MNKKELLQDLENKPFCDSLNDTAKMQEQKQDGGKWYIQNIREIQSNAVAVYRNIHFYVVDEGQPTEAAYYKDEIPDAITKKIKTFTEKINEYADTHDNVEVIKCEEDRQFAIIKKYLITDTIASEKKFIVKLVDGAIIKREIK